LSFVSLSWIRITDKLAINWQNFARVRLQLKIAFIIRPYLKLLSDYERERLFLVYLLTTRDWNKKWEGNKSKDNQRSSHYT